MLLHLSVQNYALIRQLEIDFAGGFTVITGETGAGKSILLGALNLMLGKRADTQVLLDKSKKCIVEGTFSLENDILKGFFEKNQLDYEEQAILRREIQVSGKTRAFINDTPVNVTVLKALGESLIDIHSQHQTLALNDTAFQLNVIDSFGGLSETVTYYKSLFRNYQNLSTVLKNLTEQEQRSNEEKDYLSFLFGELDAARLTDGEQSHLEQELEILNHAEEIKARLFNSVKALSSDEPGILSKLSAAKADLTGLTKYSDEYAEFARRIESCFIELKDISGNLEKLSDSVSYLPERVAEIKERLDLLYHLENKHRVQTVADLLNKRNDLKLRLDSIDSLSEEIRKISEELLQAETDLKNQANEISQSRKKYFREIEGKLTETCSELGMPDARFRIKHTRLDFPVKEGYDAVRFFFNANKGGELMDMSVVASGGELSRLMLAIKSLISKKSLLPTIIFDEIDMGVSGKIADRVGNLLKELAGSVQVLAITHLPQIAGKGNAHYFVYKESDDDTTKTYIRVLDADERILEIAKMMSGEVVSEASVETAKQLLYRMKSGL